MAENRNETAATIQHGQSHTDWAKHEERVPVFTITRESNEGEEGEATVYTMPAKPNSGIALKYLKMARTLSPDVAMSWLIEIAVGEDAYDALAAEPDMSGDQLRAIVQKIQKIAMGGLDPKAS